jgi:cation diffusion facilitator CzcD-associated flavoprotein CzcO
MRGKLDLRTGRPVWFAYRVPSVPTKKLTRDVKADVAIVGLGISGAMIAEALTAEGRTVVAIDRRGPMKARPPRRRRWCCSRSTSR